MGVVRIPALIGCCALLVGCTDQGPPRTAAEGFERAFARLGSEQDPGVVWDLLPRRYQQDLTGWARRFAERVPASCYDKLFLALQKAGVALKSKGEFLLDMRGFTAAVRSLRNADDDDILAVFESVGDCMLLMARGELGTAAKLREVDLGRFLHRTGKEIWSRAARAYRITGEDLTARIAAVRIRQTEPTPQGPSPTLTFGVGEWSFAGEFTLVDDRWVPKALVDRWPALQEQVEAWLAALQTPTTKDRLRRAETFLDQVLTDLDAIQATRNRSALGAELQRIGTRYAKEFQGLLDGLPFPR